MMQCTAHQVFVHGLDIAGFEFLGPQAIASPKHLCTVANNGFNILVQRFTQTAWFLASVQNSDTLYRLWQRRQKRITRERTVQVHLYQSQPRWQMRHCFFDCFTGTAHCDDNVFCVFIADIVNQVILTPSQFGEFIHTFLDNFRRFCIQRVCGFTSLKENVRILSSTTNGRLVWCHTTRAVFQNQRIRNHFTQHIVVNSFQTGFFVTCAEPVKEMQERHACAQCRRVRNCRHIVCLLHIVTGQQCKTS